MTQEDLLGEEDFELSFGEWLLAPFGFIISQKTVGLLSLAAVGVNAEGVCLQ